MNDYFVTGDTQNNIYLYTFSADEALNVGSLLFRPSVAALVQMFNQKSLQFPLVGKKISSFPVQIEE